MQGTLRRREGLGLLWRQEVFLEELEFGLSPDRKRSFPGRQVGKAFQVRTNI